MDTRGASAAEEINRHVHGRRATIEQFRLLDRWIDHGERRALNGIADEVRNLPVLDIGVGASRTAWFLRLLTHDYVAIDWAPEMVEVCRSEYHGLDVRQGDARDLSMFGSEQFKFVLFSYNGIDSADHPDRLRVLAEIHRVLQPDGLFLYSTLNKSGPLYNRSPWRSAWWASGKRLRRAAQFLFLLPSNLLRYRRMYSNYWRNRRYAEDLGGWAVGPMVAHEYALLQHFTLPSTEQEILTRIGFVVAQMLTDEGTPVTADDASTTGPWFYVLARKGTAARAVPRSVASVGAQLRSSTVANPVVKPSATRAR
jgi:SAM-dependent methyltransferase